jgi:uncharacterized membrane protein HdeD (DUF308 family)
MSMFESRNDTVRLGPMAAVQEHRGWFIGLGIAFFILGVLAIAVPFVATLATTLFIGWLLIIGGVVSAIHAFQNRHWAGFPWALLGSILYVVAGFLIVLNPVVGTLTLTLILASLFLVSGFVKIVRALQHRGMSSWGWLLFDGIISLVLGGLIWAKWPSTAVWAIGLLVGVELLVSGSSMLMLGLLGRPHVARVRA